MEPFRLTRQTVTFIALIAVVTAVVAVAAPFGSIALGALSLAAVGVVLIKAMFRTRRWWPLTAVEGTIAVSALVLMLGGVAVFGYSIVRLGNDGVHMMIGWPTVDDSRAGPRPVKTARAVSYTDADLQQRVKNALREAGVPFTVETREGSEYVGWAAEHNDAADAAIEKVVGKPLPSGRNAHFPDPEVQRQFMDWLTKKGIRHEVVKMRGDEYVVWDEAGGNAAHDFMRSRSGDCKGKVAGAKSGATRC
jgi:hypothetical protein